MVTILASLNNHLKREEKHMNLFLDNALSSTKVFSNIKVAFVLKNTTLRTLPLCGGTVNVWKIWYKEVVLAYHLQIFGKAFF